MPQAAAIPAYLIRSALLSANESQTPLSIPTALLAATAPPHTALAQQPDTLDHSLAHGLLRFLCLSQIKEGFFFLIFVKKRGPDVTPGRLMFVRVTKPAASKP